MRYQISLNKWNFSIDTMDYHIPVTVPHTWNVEDPVMNHRGIAFYKTKVFIKEELRGKKAFISFGAVYHTAKIFINDTFAGEHSHSGFTPFQIDISELITYGADNHIQVIVDNTPSSEMLPHQKDFDWADDGGIIRKAELLFTEPDGISFLQAEERLRIIENDRCSGILILKTAFWDGKAREGVVRILDYSDGSLVLEKHFDSIEKEVSLEFENLKLWSCHTPSLYRIVLETKHDRLEIRTGLRQIEVKGERILLNGRDIYLKGCEWMPGSHPDFGMAEPLEHSISRLKQLKLAGCSFTRFHWQQDDAVFDWCDENGLLVQEEIPYWGSPGQPSNRQLTIAKQHADEMVYFHGHHPSIVFWGVGNELEGAAPGTIAYVEDMVSYFKFMDGRRLVNYVSNSLGKLQLSQRDDATLHGDIAMWNEYLGLWEASNDVETHLIQICKKAEGMPLIISEFGLCEPRFPGGDERRAQILEQRLRLYHEIANIRGYVWFSLNDYRTQMGEEGTGKMKMRIHGSTDLYGNEKPSYQLLCRLQR